MPHGGRPASWIIDAVVQGIVTGLKLDWSSIGDAFAAFDGCSTEDGLIIDESESKNYLGSCVERDDALKPRLRIVNRRTFDVRAYPLDGLVFTDFPRSGVTMERLGRYSFDVDYSGVPTSEPLTIRAEVAWLETLVHATLDMFELVPGLDVATSGQRILVELYQNRRFISAASALAAGDAAQFEQHFIPALGEAAETVERHTGFGVRALLPVFRALGVAGIAIQFIDARNSASAGSGDLKFYSNRPSPTPTPVPAPSGPPSIPGHETSAQLFATAEATLRDYTGGFLFGPCMNVDDAPLLEPGEDLSCYFLGEERGTTRQYSLTSAGSLQRGLGAHVFHVFVREVPGGWIWIKFRCIDPSESRDFCAYDWPP